MISLNLPSFTCNQCMNGCRCIFECNGQQYCIDIEIYYEGTGTDQSRYANVFIYFYDDLKLGKLYDSYSVLVEMDQINIPENILNCINLTQDCRCS